MKLNTAIAIAVAGAFAVPFAVQASAPADTIILAQTSGKITTDPKDSNPAAPPATTGTPRSSDTTSPASGAAAGSSGATTGSSGAAAGSTSAPVSSGTNAADRAPNSPKSASFTSLDKNADGHISRDEAKDATWANRFTELDKDNDNRLSQSEFDAMQAGAATGSTGAPVTSGTNSADRRPSTPKQ